MSLLSAKSIILMRSDLGRTWPVGFCGLLVIVSGLVDIGRRRRD